MKTIIRFRGGYPLLRRILKSDPTGAWSMRKAMMITGLIAANDNTPAAANPVSLQVERRQQYKPSPDWMVSDAHRVRVTCSVKDPAGTMRRHAGAHDVQRVAADTFRLGDMVFSTSSSRRRPAVGGLMLSFGQSSKGQPIAPQVDTRDEKGGAGAGQRSEAAKRAYLALRPAVASPLTAEGDCMATSAIAAIPDMYDPRPGVEEARALLAKFGVDGSVPFKAIGLGRLLPTGFPLAMDCFGGISAGKETAKTPIQVAELVEDDPANISEGTMTVLEVVAERGSLSALGVRLGYSGGYADRAGKGALLNAVDELKRLFPAPSNKNVRRPVPFRASSVGSN